MKTFSIYAKKNKKELAFLSILTVTSSLLSLPIPYITKFIIDDVLQKEQYSLVAPLALLILLIIFFILIIGRINVSVSAKFYQGFMNSLRNKIFSNYIKGISSNQTNTLQTVIFSDIEYLSSSMQSTINTLLTTISAILGYLFFIFSISWQLSLICLIFVPIFLLWISFVSKRLKMLNGALQIAKDNIFSFLNISIGNKTVIKIYQYIDVVINNFSKLVTENSAISIKIAEYQNLIGIVSTVIVTMATNLPFFIGINLIKNGNLTLGELIAFNTYCGMLFSPVTELMGLISTLKIIRVYSDRVQQLLLNNPSLETIRYIDNGQAEKFINLFNVSIYSNKNLVLENISLKILSGRIYRIVGSNGSGKSLFLKILANLYTNFIGEVSYNNIKENSIIYVSNNQNMVLDTLADELYTNTNITQQELEKIIDLVNLSDKIKELPQQLESKCSEANEIFSTGEMQKFRLARALSRNPDFLFLDEIFSNIDKKQSEKIIDGLMHYYPDLTIIFVEHHLSDQLFVNHRINLDKKRLYIN